MALADDVFKLFVPGGERPHRGNRDPGDSHRRVVEMR